MFHMSMKIVALLVFVVCVTNGCLPSREKKDSPTLCVTEFLSAWQAGDWETMWERLDQKSKKLVSKDKFIKTMKASRRIVINGKTFRTPDGGRISSFKILKIRKISRNRVRVDYEVICRFKSVFGFHVEDFLLAIESEVDRLLAGVGVAALVRVRTDSMISTPEGFPFGEPKPEFYLLLRPYILNFEEGKWVITNAIRLSKSKAKHGKDSRQ